MSTRANIVLTEGARNIFFYRHSDGYPEGVTPTLDLLSKLIKERKLRNNITQCAGWLIIIGALEYGTINPEWISKERYHTPDFTPDDWKVGAYEITTGIHGDIEYKYMFDVTTGEYKTEEVPFTF